MTANEWDCCFVRTSCVGKHMLNSWLLKKVILNEGRGAPDQYTVSWPSSIYKTVLHFFFLGRAQWLHSKFKSLKYKTYSITSIKHRVVQCSMQKCIIQKCDSVNMIHPANIRTMSTICLIILLFIDLIERKFFVSFCLYFFTYLSPPTFVRSV